MPDSSSSEDEEELKRLQAVSVTGQDIAAAAVVPAHKKVWLYTACMTAHGQTLRVTTLQRCRIACVEACSGNGVRMM
jgi:hypothetical protein